MTAASCHRKVLVILAKYRILLAKTAGVDAATLITLSQLFGGGKHQTVRYYRRFAFGPDSLTKAFAMATR